VLGAGDLVRAAREQELECADEQVDRRRNERTEEARETALRDGGEERATSRRR
jgi:hypothetical protein